MTTKLNPYVTLKDVAQTSTNVSNLVNNNPIKYTQAMNNSNPNLWYDGLHLNNAIGPIIIDSASFGAVVNINDTNSNLRDLPEGYAASYPGTQIHDKTTGDQYELESRNHTNVSLVLPATVKDSLQPGTKIDVYVLVPPKVNGNVTSPELLPNGYLVADDEPLKEYKFESLSFYIDFGYSLGVAGSQVANVPEDGIKINGVAPPKQASGNPYYFYDYDYIIETEAVVNPNAPYECSVAHIQIYCIALGEYLIREDHRSDFTY